MPPTVTTCLSCPFIQRSQRHPLAATKQHSVKRETLDCDITEMSASRRRLPLLASAVAVAAVLTAHAAAAFNVDIAPRLTAAAAHRDVHGPSPTPTEAPLALITAAPERRATAGASVIGYYPYGKSCTFFLSTKALLAGRALYMLQSKGQLDNSTTPNEGQEHGLTWTTKRLIRNQHRGYCVLRVGVDVRDIRRLRRLLRRSRFEVPRSLCSPMICPTHFAPRLTPDGEAHADFESRSL